MHKSLTAAAILLLGTSVLLTAPLVRAGDATDETRPVLDPMQPTWLRGKSEGFRSPSPVRKFEVDTIVVSPDRRIAVINGKSVSTGEWVSGAKVLQIEPDAVTLDINGSRLTISLAVTDIKKASNDGG